MNFLFKLINLFSTDKFQYRSNQDSDLLHFARYGRIDMIKKQNIKIEDVCYKNKINENLIYLLLENNINDYVFYLANEFPFLIREPIRKDRNSLIMESAINYNKEVFLFLLNKDFDFFYKNSKKENLLLITSKLNDQFFTEKIIESFNDLVSKIDLETRILIISNLSKSRIKESSLIKLIKNNFLNDISNKELSRVIDSLLKEFKFDACKELLNVEFYKKEVIHNYENILYFDFNGFLNDGSYLLKKDTYKENFRFYGNSLFNFHKKIGLKHKDSIKLFYTNILKKNYSFLNISEINKSMISCVYFLKTNFNIDENLIKKVIINKDLQFNLNDKEQEILKDFLNLFDNVSKIQIILSLRSDIETRDSIFMYDSIKKYCEYKDLNLDDFLNIKNHNMKRIHNDLQNTLSKIGRDNIPINIKTLNEYNKLNEMKFENFKIRVPENNNELIVIGQKMSICVGNNYYANEMSNGRILIILLYSEKRIEYCVEYSILYNKINQAKAYYNTEMSKDLFFKLDSFLKENI